MPSPCSRSPRSAPTHRPSRRWPRTSRISPASTRPGRSCSLLVAAAGLLARGALRRCTPRGPRRGPRPSAPSAGLAAMPWPATLSAWGEGEALLALAFALPAVALLVGHASRSSAVAAGMLLAAAALSQPLLCAALILAVALGRRWRPGGSPWPSARARPRGPGPVAPGARPLRSRGRRRRARGAPGRARRAGDRPRPGVFLSPRARPSGRSPDRAPDGSRGPGWPWWARPSWSPVSTAGWARASSPRSQREALARASVETRPLDVLCAAGGLRDWVPALAARATGAPGPWIPPVYAEEWAARTPRPCGARLEESFRAGDNL